MQPIPCLAHDEAVLAAICYADIFDFALRREEIRTYLPLIIMSEAEIATALDGLVAMRRLMVDAALYYLPERGALVAMRRERDQVAVEQWAHIQRSLPALLHAPWIKAVLLTGSLAAGNPLPQSDIDLFLILDHRRMWLGYLMVRLWSRMPRSVEFCPNYCVTDKSPKLLFPNLFTAIEWSMAIPLKWGVELDIMERENAWYRKFLPNAPVPAEKQRCLNQSKNLFFRAFDWLLASRLGALLDRLEYRRLVWRTGKRYLPDASVYKPHPPSRQALIFAKFMRALDSAGLEAVELRVHINEQLALLNKKNRDWESDQSVAKAGAAESATIPVKS